MIIVGIDPGLKGGIAFLDNGILLDAYPTPVIEEKFTKNGKISKRKILDLQEIVKLMKSYNPDIGFLERVAARPGQGSTSMFRFGTGWGELRGIMAALDIKFELVTPQSWKRHFQILSDKEASLELARELWPDHTQKCFRLKKHDGLAEAALLGKYGFEMTVKR